MHGEQRILAVVLARGGSKGLPRKNVRQLGGRPLIAWSIAAARGSRYVDAVLVSTDDTEIAEAAAGAGAPVPWLRPAELATDTARSLDVVLHAIRWRRAQGERDDMVLVLQPTSPLRTAADIDAAIELGAAREATAVVSVCEVEHHPWWTNTLPDDGNLAAFLRPEALHVPRQALPPYYRLNGAIYLSDIGELEATGSYYGPRTFAYVMPRERSVDIDSAVDFALAEALLAEARLKG